jgi:hypothetical protein
MRLTLLLASIALLPACKRSETTPAGTEVVRWDKSMGDRPSVPGANELGPRAKKELRVLAHPSYRAPVTLKLHLETAPLEIFEGGKSYRQTSPVLVRIAVETNEDWTITGKCRGGPDYQMGPMGPDGMQSPEAMIMSCDVSLRYQSFRQDLSELVDLEIKGDGNVVATLGGGTVTVESIE